MWINEPLVVLMATRKSLLITCVTLMVCVVSPAVAVTMTFDGHQYLTMTFPSEVRNEMEDISMRIKTARANGLLLMTSSNSTDDVLLISLDGGRLRVDVNIDNFLKVSRGYCM